MPAGRFRYVKRCGNFAIKLPRFRNFIEGLRCNRWEREAWTVWRPIFKWRSLCPVLFADRVGLLLVMPWAVQPVTEEQMETAEDPDLHPSTDAEQKTENYGLVNGRALALDYGLWTADAILSVAPTTLKCPEIGRAHV